MNFLNNINLWFKGPEVDRTFIGKLHEAAESVGSKEGRKYIVISEGQLKLSSNKSEEVTFKELTKFVNEKFKGLSKQEVQAVKLDLSKIEAGNLNETKVIDLPNDLFDLTIGYFNPEEVTDLKNFFKEDIKVDSYWKAQAKSMAFGAEKWKTVWNIDPGEESPITEEIMNELMQPDPNNPGKIKLQTRPLVFIPGSFKKLPTASNEKPDTEEKPVTANNFREVIKNPKAVTVIDKEGKASEKPGNALDYDIWDKILTDHGDKAIEKGHWAIMTMGVIENPTTSRNKSYAVQQELARAEPGYDVPTLLDAIICMAAEYAITGKTSFGRKPWTYTRVQEQSGGYQIVVGGLSAAGLRIACNFFDSGYRGVAALRKFF